VSRSGYCPQTPAQVREMLQVIGVGSIADLFAVIPDGLRARSFELPDGMSEFEMLAGMERLAGKDRRTVVPFLGGGSYDHFIPAVVDHLAGRAEFATSYTPYQPECSQGTLQALYEYQTAICRLTGLDTSNASLYDGGTALAEAAFMALRITGRKKILVDGAVNPFSRQIVRTYLANLAVEIVEIAPVKGATDRKAFLAGLDDETAAIVLQNPGFFGGVDDFSDLAEKARSRGALSIVSVYPISLGLLKTPGEMGADIAVGDGQSLGNPLCFGGPSFGFLAVRKEHIRNLPGRLVGETVDKDGRRGFVLTLQAREQHIRRQKATSNICSNQSPARPDLPRHPRPGRVCRAGATQFRQGTVCQGGARGHPRGVAPQRGADLQRIHPQPADGCGNRQRAAPGTRDRRRSAAGTLVSGLGVLPGGHGNGEA